MGCTQAKHPLNSPSGHLERLKLASGYARKPELTGHRRSTGQSDAEKVLNQPHRHQLLNHDVIFSNSDDHRDSDIGAAGYKGEAKIVTREGKRNGGGGVAGSGRRSSSFGEEELVDGWPRWLIDNVPRDVLKGLIPKSAESYDKIDKVGQGTYSNVYKARDKETGKIVALKKVHFDTSQPESVKFMAREIMILQKLDHPNIVKLEGLATSRMQYSIYLVFDFMRSDLAKIISRPDSQLTEPQIKCYMQQLLSGLQHCHEKGILHRDIKGSNLLIDKNGMLKIADFGLANYFRLDSKSALTNQVVTLWYRAPELLLGTTDYGVGIDLWSAGCLMAEMYTGQPLLPGQTEVEQIHRIFKLCGMPSEEYWKKLKRSPFRPPQPCKPRLGEMFGDLPASSLDLLRTLLALEPASRGSASLALQHQFFYTNPLPCDLSGLPAVCSKDDETGQTSEKRRNSKMRWRSKTNLQHRRRDLTAEKQKEDPDSANEELKRTTKDSTQREQPSNTASSGSSGLNTAGKKRNTLLLRSPVGSSSRRTPISQGHPDAYYRDIKNMPPLSMSRKHSANSNTHDTRQVRKSASARESRNLN